MTWLCRSMDQSLRARQLRNACSAGIILDPGIWLLWANWSNFRRTRSGTNKNRPPQRVVNVRGARDRFRTSAMGSMVGRGRSGRVTESASDFGGRPVVDEIGSQSLVHALLGVIRLEKEFAAVA